MIKTFIPCQISIHNSTYAILRAYTQPITSIFCCKQLEITNQTGMQINICIIYLPSPVKLSKRVQRNASFMIHNFRKKHFLLVDFQNNMAVYAREII